MFQTHRERCSVILSDRASMKMVQNGVELQFLVLQCYAGDMTPMLVEHFSVSGGAFQSFRKLLQLVNLYH